MAIGDVHIAGSDGWALCGSGGPLNGYNATSPACRECENLDWDRRHGVTIASAPETQQARSFRIINGTNGYGLSRDGDIVSDALFAAGWRRVEHGRVTANIHLERVNPHVLSTAQHNVVIPNPEWWCHVGNVSVGDLNHALHDPSTRVWAKTQDAEQIFRQLGARVEYIGFRSNDRHYPLIPRERGFLHVAGEGPNKRTEQLLALWQSDWPLLTITCGSRRTVLASRPNVRVVVERMDDGELRALQNRNLFHIYPSRYEGFGHAQWEGLSCGAIVFVCDGAPFDEHAEAFRLLASKPNGSPDWNDRVLWRDVQPGALVEAVAWAQALSDDEIINHRAHHRKAWEQATGLFIQRIYANIATIDDLGAP